MMSLRHNPSGVSSICDCAHRLSIRLEGDAFLVGRGLVFHWLRLQVTCEVAVPDEEPLRMIPRYGGIVI